MPDDKQCLHVIITIHGIRTYGRWQNRLQNILDGDRRWQQEKDKKEILNYRYGVFTLFSFIIPFLRNLAVNQFRDYLESVFEGRECHRVDIIAHSFGTYLAIKALANPKLASNVRIHTAILCGAAVSPNQNLSRLVGTGRRIGRVVNECGIRDGVLLLTLPVYGVGMAGRIGLQGLEGNTLRNRFHRLGHSGYFEHTNRRPYDGFIKRWWLPLLLDERPISDRDRRPENPPFADRFWRLLGENGATVAVSIYTVIFLGLAAIIGDAAFAKREAAARRYQALIAQSRFLGAHSLDAAGRYDYAEAISTALEGLPETLAAPSRPFVAETAHGLWDILRRYPMRTVLKGHHSPLRTVAFSPDGTRVVTGGNDGARLWDVESGRQIAVLEDQSMDWRKAGTIGSIAYSSDGQRIATASWHGPVWIWNADGKLVATLKEHQARTWTAVFSELGDQVLTASDDGTAQIFDLDDNGKQIVKVELAGKTVGSAIFSPDGKAFATASQNKFVGSMTVTPETLQGTAQIWNAEDGTEIASFKSRSGFCDLVIYSPDGKLLAVNEVSDVVILDIAKKKEVARLAGHTDVITGSAFSTDQKYFATSSKNGSTLVWDTASWTRRYEIDGEKAAFSSDSSRLITVSDFNFTATIWDTETGQKLQVLKGHNKPIVKAVFTHDDRRIVTASDDNTARVWNSDGGVLSDTFNIFHVYNEQGVFIRNLRFIDDGRKLVTQSGSRSRLWQADSGRAISVLPNEQSFVPTLDFTENGKYVISAEFDGTATLRDVATGEVKGKFAGKGSSVNLNGVAVSADDDRLITWYNDGATRIWDIKQTKQLAEIKGTGRGIWSVGFLRDGRLQMVFYDGTVRISNRDGGGEVVISKANYQRLRAFDLSMDARRVIARADDRTIEIRDTTTERAPIVKSDAKWFLLSVAMSADGKYAAIGSQDHLARVYNAETGAEVAVMKGHNGSITAVRFTADGKYLITGSEDRTARIWDAKKGTQLLSLSSHKQDVKAIAVTEDGQRIATATDDGTIRIWRNFTSDQSLIDYAKSVAPQCLPQSQRKQFGLDPMQVPQWCITGPDHEQESDPSKWEPKWPYQAQAWKEWLLVRRAGKNRAIPSAQ